jgi:hypothetical protein
VHDNLETQDALAFGIGLQRQLAEMQFEHRQVILRSLEHDCQSRSMFAVRGAADVSRRTEFSTRAHPAERGSGHHALKDLLHRCLERHRWIRLSGQTETRCVGTVDLDVKELGQASRVEDLSAMFAAGNGGVAMPCRRSARMECYGRGDGRVPRSCTSFK